MTDVTARTSRTVVISGGGSGIGRASARWFAERGDRVWIVGRREGALAAAADSIDGDVHYVVADLGRADGARAVRAALAGGPVDVVVPAAGGTSAAVSSDLDEVEAYWRDDLKQNLLTAVLLVEAVQPILVARGARVVGVGSIGAQLGSGYGGSYGAAKAGLAAWIFWLAARLGPQGGTANLVLPGYIPDTEFFGARMTSEFDQVRVERTLLGRAGTSDEVAAAIGFLASSEAGYITGQLLGISGGTVLGR